MSNYSANKYTKDTQNDSWNKIFEFIEDESRVLDIGCSSGNLGATLIQEKKCEVVGLDLNEQDVKIAKKQLSEAYVMNAETDNLSRLGKFDAIVFADVIEHLVDPVTTLKKFKKSLNPGGAGVFRMRTPFPGPAATSMRYKPGPASVVPGEIAHTWPGGSRKAPTNPPPGLWRPPPLSTMPFIAGTGTGTARSAEHTGPLDV